jgi:hypothetical protein
MVPARSVDISACSAFASTAVCSTGRWSREPRRPLRMVVAASMRGRASRAVDVSKRAMRISLAVAAMSKSTRVSGKRFVSSCARRASRLRSWSIVLGICRGSGMASRPSACTRVGGLLPSERNSTALASAVAPEPWREWRLLDRLRGFGRAAGKERLFVREKRRFNVIRVGGDGLAEFRAVVHCEVGSFARRRHQVRRIAK